MHHGRPPRGLCPGSCQPALLSPPPSDLLPTPQRMERETHDRSAHEVPGRLPEVPCRPSPPPTWGSRCGVPGLPSARAHVTWPSRPRRFPAPPGRRTRGRASRDPWASPGPRRRPQGPAGQPAASFSSTSPKAAPAAPTTAAHAATRDGERWTGGAGSAPHDTPLLTVLTLASRPR